MEIEKICQLCNKVFITDTVHNDNICNNKHIFKCLNCNKDIVLDRNTNWYTRNLYLTTGKIFCNNKCSVQYGHYIKFMERYKDIAVQIKELYESTPITKNELMEKFNLSQDTFNKILDRFHIKKPENLRFELYSVKSKKQYNEMSNAAKLRQLKKLSEKGKQYWSNVSLNEVINRATKIKETWKNKSNEEKQEIIDKIKRTKQGKTITEKADKRKKISTSITEWWANKTEEEINNIIEKGIQTRKLHGKLKFKSLDGLFFDSSYELKVYEFCKRNNLRVETQVPIKYNYMGKEHTTYIDFRIDDIYFECKGHHLLMGIYDDMLDVPIECKLQVYTQNNVILIIDSKSRNIIPPKNSSLSNGLKYLNKCSNPLIGLDITLFDKPEFPFDINKPECFYKVRVNKKPSPYEVWNDEKLRWKMIINRINYVGGFIDNKEILNAMNVTRTCKQPSWFSKKFAKKLIQKYITTDIIYDPFAGWGARCDACKDLKIKYIGCDLNEELVKWHKEQDRNITCMDANDFKCNDNNCSVFICPPYQDFETYFDGQDLKTTQIGWLKIVMNNIPNAKEYLMVFKIIDKDEYKKYIVEEKINKSHFGTNKEYVMLVKQKDKEKFLNI